MKGIIFVAGLFCAFLMCTALNQNQIDQLEDLNFMFDILHKNYDNEINRAWERQKHNMKVLNAQFISRFGFIIEEVKDKETEVLEAIAVRGEEIGDPNAECVENIRLALANAVDYANMNFEATIQEILIYFNMTNEVIFYPNVEIFHFQSNTFQWEILNALVDINPVTDMDGLIQRLLADYYVILELYEQAVETLARDIDAYNQEFNRVRGSVFPTFDNVKAYFIFTCNMLIDTLALCT